MFNQEEIGRPLESIMKCEDFKSNFARKLSHRYSSKPSLRQDSALKISKSELPTETTERVVSSQLPNPKNTEQNGDAKPPDKTDSNLKNIEVNALNMEVETLRWQLSQTEVNRQMHIALLKQVVSFLSRVKEHIEYQKPELGRNESMSRLAPRMMSSDLPRSKSVLHVNKNREFSVSPAKKLATRKISKSISNVSGYKDSNGWIPSTQFPNPQENSSLKITEEMTRLINLANSVLSTKLPDLASTFCEPEYATISETPTDDKSQTNDSTSSLNFINEDITNPFILNTICDSEDAFECVTYEIESKDVSTNFSPQLPMSGLENEYAEVKIADSNSMKATDASPKARRFVEKRNEYNLAANFIEDESGFSSMSSFQEIGLPIISIIPPSPCKEVGYVDDIADILEDTNWKSPLDLDKQAVKVFWV